MIGSPEPAPGEQLILVDLAAVGFDVGSLTALRRSGLRYREAIPILLDWLGRVSDPKVKEQIVRALSVPWAKPAATRPMIDEFRAVDETVDSTGMGLRWAMGNALEVLFSDAEFDALVDLAGEKRYGQARQMVVLGLGKSKRPEVVDVLLGLVDDPDVGGHALQSLAKLRAPAARSAFESKLDDRRAWVRKIARRGLETLAG